MFMSYDTLLENSVIELKALVKTEEYDGYGAMKFRSSHEICQMWYQLVDHYGFDREVVPVALNYFCRYISKRQSSDRLTRENVHCLAITSIFIAIKIHSMGEENLAEARARALSRLAYGHFEAREVLDMEKEMLQTLDWRVNPPTMHQFAIRFSGLHPLGRVDSASTDYLHEVTRYQVELAVFFPELMMNYKPSVIAYAAMLRAEEELDHRVLTFEMRDKFLSLQAILKMEPAQVEEAKSALENLIPQVPDMNQYEDLKQEPTPTNVPVTTERDGSISPTGVAGR